MKINDLIFKELLKRGYNLEGKTRVWDIADSKLWYLSPKQAQGFLDLGKTEGYRKSIIEKEVYLIKKHLKEFIEFLPKNSYNLIDLGCGDGEKATLFIQELEKYMQLRYCPIDISSYMVSKAAERVRNLKIDGDILEFKWNISDFENLNNITPLLRGFGGRYENHFMMLLGNTLGNFDRDDILHGIKNSMEKEDVLIIGNGIAHTNNSEEWVKEYKDSIINKWLREIPLQLGLTQDDIEYDVRFVNSRIEELYIIKKDKKIEHLGKRLEFKKGDILVTAISYKYSKEDFYNILKTFFSNVEIYLDDAESYSLAICRNV